MHYESIEIGSSDFDLECLLNLEYNNYNQSIVIDPIQYRLDNIPNNPSINKLCAGIVVSNNKSKTDYVFYLKDDIIQEYNLPIWLKGCASIGYIHPTVRKYISDESKISKQSVNLYSILDISKIYNITSCNKLKIDIEGMDADLVCDIISLYKDGRLSWIPDEILFESNELSDKKATERVISLIKSLSWFYKPVYDNILVYSG